MFFNIRDGLTYDDVLLVPQYSTIESRSKVDTSVKLGNFEFSHPIIAANMKTITDYNMALSVIQNKGLAILHRFMPLEQQLNYAEDFIEEYNAANYFGISIGIKEKDKDAVTQFIELGLKIICIDIAHGDSKQCLEMIEWIKNKYSNILLIAGNVATGNAAKRLWGAGADVVKVGIGPGSLCSTRIETGNGVPQLSAIIDVYEAKISYNVNKNLYIIADGGIKNAGDCVKSLCFADMVMTGNIFAGCEETPGNIINMKGSFYKEYVGSSTYKSSHIEGVSALVPCKGTYNDILTKLLEGIRSGMSYQGCNNLTELKDNPVFIKITNAGLKESHPHDVILK